MTNPINSGLLLLNNSLNRIKNQTNNFYFRLNPLDEVKILDAVFELVSIEHEHDGSLRFRIMQLIFKILLCSCDISSIKMFYNKSIGNIVTLLKSPAKVKASTSHMYNKIIGFILLELLYGKLSPTEIDNDDSPISISCKENCPLSGKIDKPTKFFVKFCDQAVKEISDVGVNWEVHRLQHCFAYNALISIICCVKKEIKFYTAFLFPASKVGVKSQDVWENLVDFKKNYSFGVSSSAGITYIRFTSSRFIWIVCPNKKC